MARRVCPSSAKQSNGYRCLQFPSNFASHESPSPSAEGGRGGGGDGEGGEGEASPNVEAARVVCLLSRFPRPDDYQVAAELVAKSLGKGGGGGRRWEKNEEGKFLPRKALKRFLVISFPTSL